jgi:iron(III) transport system permease protein
MLRWNRFSHALIAGSLAVMALAVIILLAPVESRRAMLNSAILAAGATAIALPLGTLLAVLLTRFDLPGRRVAAACLGVLLFLPLYVQLAGWDAALGKLGWYSLASGSMAHPLLVGMRGAICIHALAAIPWVALLVGIGLTQIDPAQEEAALLVVPPRIVLWRITLPQTLPFILAAAIWVVVSTTSEMTVTNIYLINSSERTYTEQFYMTFALSADAERATIAVLPGVTGLMVVIVATLWMVVKLCSRRIIPDTTRSLDFNAGIWRPLLTAGPWLIILALLGVPVASLLSKAGFVVLHRGETRIPSWSAAAALHEVIVVPWRFAAEFRGTLLVAAGAATLALLAAIVLAWPARRGSWPATGAIVLSVLGLTIPGPLVGAVLIQLFNHDIPPAIHLPDGALKSWLLMLYDETPLAPILAQAIRALPLATLLLWHSFATLSDDVLAAASLDGLSPWRVFEKIAIPQRWRAVLAAWIAAFAVAAGDLAWAHLVTPPGLDLLQRRVFGLVHSGVEEQVAAIAFVNIFAYAVLATAVMFLLRAQRGRTKT